MLCKGANEIDNLGADANVQLYTKDMRRHTSLSPVICFYAPNHQYSTARRCRDQGPPFLEVCAQLPLTLFHLAS